jgi:hypothetical protein
MFRYLWVTTLQRNMRALQRAVSPGDRPDAHKFLRTSLASLDVSVMNERPADMPTRVFMLALQCMHMTPSQRPTAAEWVRSLRRLLDAWPEHEASPAALNQHPAAWQQPAARLWGLTALQAPAQPPRHPRPAAARPPALAAQRWRSHRCRS